MIVSDPRSVPLTLTDYLLAEDWEPGAPLHIDIATLSIDCGVCLEAFCPECHHKGLRFQPWRKGRRYRAVGLCVHCTVQVEF